VTARNQAMMNRVADALLLNLQAIGNPSATLSWLTSPKTAQRGFSVDLTALAKPGIFLLSQGWGPNEPIMLIGGNLTARVEAKFTVLCVIDSPMLSRDAEQRLNNLASDVINAVYLDYQLGTLLDSGYLTVTGYQPQVELSNNSWSVASVDVLATWLWDTTNP
jgi:hypothetical protein